MCPALVSLTSPAPLTRSDHLNRYKMWTFLLIWLSIFILIAGVAILSLKKPVVVRKRALSINVDVDGDADELARDEGEQPENEGEDLMKGRGRGWLGNMIGKKRDVGERDAEGMEMGRRERRTRKGTKKLHDQVEEEEEDAEQAPIFDAEDFGEFKVGEEEESSSREAKESRRGNTPP